MPVTNTYPGDAGTDGGVPAGCTETCNSPTLTVSCSNTSSGFTESSTYTVNLSTGAGSLSITSTGADGGVLLSCSYTVQVTPGQ